jgi:hypothetical protein
MTKPSEVTEHQWHLLKLRACNWTEHEIAAHLGISRKTVSTQLVTAKARLQMHNWRAGDLMAYMLRRGVIQIAELREAPLFQDFNKEKHMQRIACLFVLFAATCFAQLAPPSVVYQKTITLTCAVGDPYYTTDGSTPVYPGNIYSGPFELAEGAPFKTKCILHQESSVSDEIAQAEPSDTDLIEVATVSGPKPAGIQLYWPNGTVTSVAVKDARLTDKTLYTGIATALLIGPANNTEITDGPLLEIPSGMSAPVSVVAVSAGGLALPARIEAQ